MKGVGRMDMPHHAQVGWNGFEAIVALVCMLLLVLYAAALASRQNRKWPIQRSIFWFIGIIAVLSSVAGPLARLAYTNFTAHMAGHLLLGMLAPLLLVYAKPMTLLLRTLPVSTARKVSKGFKSRPLQFFCNPAVAAILNIGGLYAIYLTDIFSLMHELLWLYTLIHLHLLLAGYLFTLSILTPDLTPHRYGFGYRSIVLVLALAAHKILSKLIYAKPPAGVEADEAQAGAMLMYYGGDAIDLILIVLLCYQWYKAASKREKSAFSSLN